ncbi:thyroid adenoma-associated protein homolog isoform X3 [Stylophora pistillata]|nr:thyroid adenoma-associated protein homolog isoform X3 [Stylophora pistillata]
MLGEDVNIRHYIDMLADMLDSFTLGADVLLNNGYLVFKFLGVCLKEQWKVAKAESSPALQTSLMMDCLAVIKTIISFLQKSSSEPNMCNLFDQLGLLYIEKEDTGHSSHKDLNLSLGIGKLCGSSYTDVSETVKRWNDLMTEVLVDLCGILFDDQFFLDCQLTAGLAILAVIKVMCPVQNVVSTIGKVIFPSQAKSGHLPISPISDPKIVSIFQDSPGITSFSHLCLCRGVLAIIPLHMLVEPSEVILDSQSKHGTLMFDALFPDLCSLCDSLKECNTSIIAFRTLTLWANQARQIATSNHCNGSWLKEKLYGTSPIPTKLLTYVWTHWDHPVEGVRYQTKAICEHVVNLHLIVGQADSSKEDFLQDLAASLLNVSWHVRGKYGPLCCITSVVGATKMLRWFPSIPQDMFPLMSDRNLAPHAMDFIEQMTVSHKKEILESGEDIKGWMKIWIVPFLNFIHCGCRLLRENLAQFCLPKLLKCCPESLQFLVQYLQDNNELKESNLGTLVTCLKIARSLGLMDFYKMGQENFFNKPASLWCGVVPEQLMRKALCHLDDQIRLDALGLVCDSPRATELITELDLQLLQLFIPHNMNNQAPSFRQQAATHLKRLLTRLKECIRISSKAAKKKKDSSEKQFSEHQLTLYRTFLQWFCAYQFDSMFPSASFTRRTTALSNLMLIKDIFRFEENDDSTIFNMSEVMSQDNIHILLDCLSDSYQINKTMAYDLLMESPTKQLPFQEEKSLLAWLSMIDQLVSSPRAIDASTASTFLTLLVEKCELPLKFVKSETEQECLVSESTAPCPQALRVVKYLTSLLQSHRSAASKNLYLTGAQAPMHGVLHCLRAVLGYVSLSSVSDDKQWQSLLTNLIEECICTADIVSPVVTSSSPEGFMIYDSGDSVNQIPQQSVLEESHIKAPASQILLVCCWRTMKEVALLLGELVENAPLYLENSKHGLIPKKQMCNIGDFFTKVLLTSKHRGAFELAYTGFVKLCTVLWRSKDTELRQLPAQWLQTLLTDLTSDSPSEALCGTRRSAGVPFFIQAIVTTEPSAAANNCFRQVMAELLQVAANLIDSSSISDSTLPQVCFKQLKFSFSYIRVTETYDIVLSHLCPSQVHACNILRALYRDTKLGEAVFPFVSDGVVVAIDGFLSESWAVRNSSTMLFSALVTRIFGVKRGKDEHSRKNCMTGREFFSRFPELHSFFLSHLQVACQGIERDTIRASLHPVLVMLARLYPSPMDGVDSTLNMAMFVPFVISCRKSLVIKTRVMSARALVPLVSGDLLVQTLQELLLSLPVSSSGVVRQNPIHGTLLHVSVKQ